ncbi:MAG: dipeptide epimerase [Alphaproteobacteria bacterium]|nr:dipeptide epimerase [Alphaproteobacteria bacterium]
MANPSKVDLRVAAESFPLAQVFRISRGARTHADVVTVTLTDGDAKGQAVRGWGECVPYPRYGESVDSVIAQIEAMRGPLSKGLTRQELQEAMPNGAARNAVDNALWDLEAKRTGTPVWTLAGLDAPRPVVTCYTLSLDAPEKMAAQAREHAARPIFKLKLTGDGDLDRVRAIHEAVPTARLVVDANEAWTIDHYVDYAGQLGALGVEMIEQPLPAGQDEALRGIERPLPVCADESCHDRASLDDLAGKYDRINIKLDKTGGLTEALALRDAARARGFGIMVGCMVGSSLAMAPGVLVAQGAEVVDLDGPLLFAKDREPGLVFEGSTLYPPAPELWG